MHLPVIALAGCFLLSQVSGTGRGAPAFWALLLWFLVLSILDIRHVVRAAAALLWLSLGAAGLAVAQLLVEPRPPGPFASPNFLGAGAAVCLFLAIHLQHYAIAAANLAAVVVSQSRGALLAVGAGYAVLLWRRHPRIAIATVAGGLLVALIIRQGQQGAEVRLEIWHAAIAGAIHRPLTGWGPDGLWVMANGTFYHRFYSIPLDWFAATGMLGIVAGCWVLVAAWVRSPSNPTMQALIATWCVQGTFISAHPATMAPFFLALALIGRDVPNHAGVVDDDKPLLDRGVRPLRTQRGHRRRYGIVPRP